MDFSYFIVFRFYFWILGVVLLTTFLVYCSNINLLWWKIEWKLKMAIWRALRHLDWHPLPKRPKFKMAAFSIRTAKFFFAKSLLLLQVSIMESYTKFHQHKFFNLGFSILYLDFCCLTIFASGAKNHLFLLLGACQMARMTQNALGIHLRTWKSHPKKTYNKC